MMQMNKKACKELLMQRMIFAIISSITIQFCLVSCLLLITNLNTNYMSWIQNTWKTVTSFRMWSYFCILATVTFFQGIICSKNYSNTPPYLKSRFIKFCGIFTSQNIITGALYIIIGGLLVWLHLSIKGNKYGFLMTECNIVCGTCLKEEHYFLLLSGFWSGLYFFLKTNIFHMKYLKFPIISTSKLFRFKAGICSMLPSLMVECIWPTVYYLIGYYFLGSYCCSTILFLSSAQLENEPLSSIPSLLSLSLIFQLWLYQLVFILTINSMYLMFELYLTEWVPFEFKQSNVLNSDEFGVTLPEALSIDKVPIMQHLAYLDLITIAQKDQARRSILFTLSQPGGHAYNWSSVVEKCIGLIKKFADDLNEACVKPQEIRLSSCAPSSTMTNISTFQKGYIYRMRNLVKEEVQIPTEESDIKKNIDNELFIQKFIKTKWNNFLIYLLSKPLISYIFGEIEGGKVCYMLFNGQTVIWAADAISSLAALSLSEDSYGIAQKDLPLIINTLLALKQALDKLQKSNIMAKKQDGDDKFIKQMFYSLRAATKRSLYRIVTSFEAYIKDIALETTTVEQLYGFLAYRE
ncbi:Nucleoporin NDC1 [Eufriesea mexicana]|uniref:Nucleoporin NDC1 n=1 Tax=Eufriesea mexicana TaxID=516756 RepID=A0A310SU18_9HYME|nr:PREDICTED: nucleoporin NDC1 [Eufriesea mexicana]OAD61659.1 Nucleoporin NDC1 [Eufriesea mexicana]